MCNLRIRARCAALLLAAVFTALSVVTSAAAVRPHPMFGNTVFGNSAEILTMWPDLYGGQTWGQMKVSDYDSVTTASLIHGAQSAYLGISWPYNQQSDAAAGDFDGDGLEDVVWAYTHDMANPEMFYLYLAVSNMRAGDFYMGDGYNYTEQHGGVYSQPEAYRDPGNVRLAAGNFDTTDTKEFVLVTRDKDAYGTKRIKLELMKLDSLTRHPVSLTTQWSWEQPDDLRESQRFDVATGDFDNDGMQEIALGGVKKRADNGNMEVFVTIYKYEGGTLVEKITRSTGDRPQALTAYGEGTYLDHVAIATGHLRPDALTDQIVFSWTNRTASWYEHFWGCTMFNNEWEFYVSTTSYLKELVVDATGGSWWMSGWVGAGSRQAVSIEEQVLNTCDARYDPQWTSPSLGLAVGDLTGDGLDEVAWAALNHVHVYQVDADTLAWRAAVLRAAPGAVGPRDAVRSCVYNDASRRMVQVANLDPHPDSAVVWRPELVIQDRDGAQLRTRVYRATTNALGGITGLGSPLLTSSAAVPNYESSVTMVCGDFDGDAVRAGTPKRLMVNNVIHPEIVLGAPPIHYAWLDGQEWDIGDCYPGFANCLDFAAQYTKESTSGQAISTTVRTDFGLSTELKSTLGAEVPGVGSANLERSLTITFGANFERTGSQSTEFTETETTHAYGGDYILASRMSYVIWEYPVYKAGRQVMGHIAVVVPDPTGPLRTWETLDSWLDLDQAITHEPGNLLSYPEVPPNPADSTVGSLWRQHPTGWTVGAIGALARVPVTPEAISGSFAFTAEHLSTYEQTAGFKAGIALGAKLEAEVGVPLECGLILKGGVSAEVKGSFEASELLTHSTKVGQDINIEATLGHISSDAADAYYAVRPFLYRARTGALVLDYAVQLTGPWWQAHYGGAPDLTFMMPWFFRAEKGYTVTDPTTKYKSPDIILSPPYAPAGDTARVFVIVRNYSLASQTGNVSVKLFAGDPDGIGSVPLTDTNTGNSTFVITGGIAPRDGKLLTVDFVVPPSASNPLRIFAVVDPSNDVAELREENNKGYGVLYTSSRPLLDVSPAGTPVVGRLDPNAPNPFSSSTRIQFVVPQRARTTLRIYDLAGRRVATLVNAELPAGQHTFRWEGRGDNGRLVEPGVYFYQLHSGAFTGTRRMLLLR